LAWRQQNLYAALDLIQKAQVGEPGGPYLEMSAMPMGMLTRKTKRQPSKEVTKPPREGPIAKPAEILIALIPRALPRSAGGKEAVIMA
jgi:hypothetical protein